MAGDNSYDSIFCLHSASVYNICYAGVSIETTVARNVSAVEKWIRESPGTIFVLETGWCNNSPVTLHLCAQNRCLIIQLRYLHYIPDLLRSFCSDECRYFISSEIYEKVSSLHKEYKLEFPESAKKRLINLELDGYFIRKKCEEQKDQQMSRLMSFYILKRIINETDQFKDIGWAEEELDIKLVKQATVEAYVSYIIGCNIVP